MKLSLDGIKDTGAWTGYHLPDFDIQHMRIATAGEPKWLHFGPGNIFRAFLCVAAQRLLEKKSADTGIICVESRGTELVTECFRPHDNLAVAVTLNLDGNIDKEVVASISESLTTADDMSRIEEIFCAPSLQMVSFTITEKGYAIRGSDGKLLPRVREDMEIGPAGSKHLMALLAAMCIKRYHACGKPLALVSMDNCSHNGEMIETAVWEIAAAWRERGFIDDQEMTYLKQDISCPWTMIDKITPRPDARVEEQLEADGIEDIRSFVTSGGVYAAPFVNAERPQYLVIEDNFPNGRPALEEAGILFTDRDTVNKVEKMKVCTCLNPLHTALAIFGCLLGHTSIAAEMQQPKLKSLVMKMAYDEGMPVVVNPGIIDPAAFLEEVLTERFLNPFLPDTPQRIATDTSQKLPIRFGETIKAHMEHGTAGSLKLIPLVLAGWLRYLLAVDDKGEAFAPSSDPLLAECQEKLCGIFLGDTVTAERLRPLLANKVIFGVDLFEAGLAEQVAAYFNEMLKGPGSVLAALRKYAS